MKNNEIDINSIVKIETMAVIKQQLDEVEKIIDDKVKDIPETLKKIKSMSFDEQENEKKDIKSYQQHLSKILEQLENKRKEIKKQINKPYDEFNEYYTNGVYTKLNNGINELKEVVNDIESLQKDEKRLELEEFANQHIEYHHLENIIKFEDISLNITLSASMKSLKEEILEFITKVGNDLELINTETNKDEIMYEYLHNGFMCGQAMLTIRKRHEDIQKISEQQDKVEEIQQEEQKVAEKVEEIITPPKQIIEDDEVIKVSFTITTTKEKIKKLKEFLKEEGIEYE